MYSVIMKASDMRTKEAGIFLRNLNSKGNASEREVNTTPAARKPVAPVRISGIPLT